MKWSVVERRTQMQWSFYHLSLSQKLVTLSSFAFYYPLVCLFTHDLDTQNVQYCNVPLDMPIFISSFVMLVSSQSFSIDSWGVMLHNLVVPTIMLYHALLSCEYWSSFCLHIEILLHSLSCAELAHSPTTNAFLFIFLVELTVIP